VKHEAFAAGAQDNFISPQMRSPKSAHSVPEQPEVTARSSEEEENEALSSLPENVPDTHVKHVGYRSTGRHCVPARQRLFPGMHSSPVQYEKNVGGREEDEGNELTQRQQGSTLKFWQYFCSRDIQ
jgi:hypothetical protein